MSNGPTLRVRKARSYSVVPDAVLTDERLSLSTRAVLAWLIGRPDGWEVHVWHVRQTFDLTEPRWARMRKEMTDAGYFRQWRSNDPNTGRVVWGHEVWDEPLEPPIPTKSGDGPSIPPKTMDGPPMAGRRGDVNNKSPSNKRPTIPPSVLPKLDDGGREEAGCEIEISGPATVHRALIAEVAAEAGLTPEQHQQLADELAGRLADRNLQALSIPRRWLEVTATSICKNGVTQYGQVVAAARRRRAAERAADEARRAEAEAFAAAPKRSRAEVQALISGAIKAFS